MKRYGDLKKIWCTYETLLQAFNEVKKHKTYKDSFLMYENNLAVNLSDLLTRLDNGSYMPRAPYQFTIYEPKERIIQAPHLEDRIVQHALLIATRAIIERRFLSCSYACRVGYGTHKASDDLKRALIEFKNGGYYLKLDIKKYFYSISHKQVLKLLKRIIKCEPTLELFAKFFEAKQDVGLALGNVTSQILANLMLNPIDHFIKRVLKIKNYFRYMDDFILLGKCKKTLYKFWGRIEKEVKNLCLSLNKKSKVGKISDGIDFVGFKTWYNRRVIRKSSLFRIKRKLKKDANISQIASFLSHSKRTNSLSYVINKILEVVPHQKNFVKQWIINNRGESNALFQS
ncbi:MAG: reverse transcriptase domain-containing protein [Candidatus Doudnabacteria bacterium]